MGCLYYTGGVKFCCTVVATKTFPLSLQQWFGNEYFRICPNISESEPGLLIPTIPNITEYFRIRIGISEACGSYSDRDDEGCN